MHIEPLQASTRFYPHFTLLRIRSIGFGLHPRDFCPFKSTPLVSCGLVAFALASSFRVNLATQMHSLARYSKRTIELRRALSIQSYQVSGSFDSLLWVLFNFPSRYSCAIGLQTYLRLEVDASRFPTPSPGSGTQELAKVLLGFFYGAVTL